VQQIGADSTPIDPQTIRYPRGAESLGHTGETMQDFADYHDCTILYIDDEEKSLVNFSRVFRNKFNILSAASASEGYRLLEKHRDEIALLMTDQRMPGEKGVDFLKRARQLQPKAVCILTTAYTDFDVAIDAVNSGAISKLITKPWNIPQLEMILREACDFFTAQRESDLSHDASLSGPSKVTTPEVGADFGELRTLEQIAHYLNVDKFTVYRLITQKKIPAFKVGNQWRFKQEMIEAWLMEKANIKKTKSDR
jgi:excisionase family DNA binding protein